MREGTGTTTTTSTPPTGTPPTGSPASGTPTGTGTVHVRHRDEHLLTGPYRVLASTVLGVVVLAVLGAVMGPQWDPMPLTDPLAVETTSTAIGDAPALEHHEVRQEIVELQLDGTTVEAQLSVPVGLAEPARAAVFVHGAGTRTYSDAFFEQAHALAEAGVVTLVPNKRLDTYTLRHRDYVAMADDYARSVAYLRSLPEVDPERVGVYAESEGAWIAPVMAAQDPDLEFVVLVSAPVVPPRQQAAFAADTYLRATGVPHGVFRAIPRAVGMAIPGGGFEYVDFDATTYQRRMTQPVLMVYGTGDSSMPIVQGAVQVIRDAAIAGNSDVTVRYYEGASHGIRVDDVIVPTFLRDVAGWVVGLPDTAGASPKIAGDQPNQTFLAMPVPEPRWLHNGDVVAVTILASCAVVLLAGLVVPVARGFELVAARRGSRTSATRRFAPGVARWAAALGVGAVVTTAAFVWYILVVARLALDYTSNGLVVTGLWIAIRLVGVLVVAAGCLLFRSIVRNRAHAVPIAPGAARTVSLGGVVAASAVLLVVLAYWGVYQLGI
ncbi:alpha/beta hydrolase family protein [Cellulomonas palmilytica]|uniref:alpha/beta hydrolase family protein n=1 Tax=Cellulomonas palmilytica TaxID=2608402 RepID=UPI00295003ED|nr:acyl-CoA thioester hydrolase/BAAT C-terminal domain-containing protein [Cellulomonas palmilytica]